MYSRPSAGDATGRLGGDCCTVAFLSRRLRPRITEESWPIVLRVDVHGFPTRARPRGAGGRAGDAEGGAGPLRGRTHLVEGHPGWVRAASRGGGAPALRRHLAPMSAAHNTGVAARARRPNTCDSAAIRPDTFLTFIYFFIVAIFGDFCEIMETVR